MENELCGCGHNAEEHGFDSTNGADLACAMCACSSFKVIGIRELQAEVRRLREALERIDRLIGSASILSIHSQQWRKISEAQSVAIMALGNPDPQAALKEAK